MVAAAALMTAWMVHFLIPGPVLVRCIIMGLFTLSVTIAGAWVMWLTPEDRALLLPRVRPVVEVSG